MNRAPAVAGRFYPAEPAALAAAVTECMGPPPYGDEHVRVVVAPHAGYVYSGAVAGAAYARVHVPDQVVVLCPNHTGHGARSAIISQGAFAMPGYDVPIAETLAEELRELAILTEDVRAHATEHSLEVHLPFLRARNPHVRIVPVCLGTQRLDACARIGHALADVVNHHGGDVLVVASTDMSHYVSADVARTLDHRALAPLLALDAEGLYRTVVENDISMCGFIPTTVALYAAKSLDAQRAELVRYANSGDVSGDYERVVGYASVLVA